MNRIVSCYFGEPGSNYVRMARVLEATALEHCPGWEVDVHEMRRDPVEHYPKAQANHIYNTQKLDDWHEAIEAADDGDVVALLDADTMIINDISPILRHSFDVAFAVKSGRLPFNGGVVFIRVGPASRRFMEIWVEKNALLIRDKREHQRWRKVCLGMNQAALAAVLRSHIADVTNIRKLSCVEWNCEQSAWEDFDPELTKILHIKSNLRGAVFGGKISAWRLGLEDLANVWHEAEAALVGEADRVAN